MLKFLGQGGKKPSKPCPQGELLAILPCQVACGATFCERLRVSSCKMKGVDIFEISTNSGFQLYFQRVFRTREPFLIERN